MTKDAPGLWWVGPGSPKALLRRAEYRSAIEYYWLQEIRWRWAIRDDWPSKHFMFSDFSHAKEGGFGFVADLGSKRLFLVPRGWDEPEWALGENDLGSGRWRDLGDFEPASPMWVLPKLIDHPSHPTVNFNQFSRQLG